jgi:cytochrome c
MARDEGELLGMAGPGCLNLDKSFTVFGAVEMNRLDPERLSSFESDGSACLHGCLPRLDLKRARIIRQMSSGKLLSMGGMRHRILYPSQGILLMIAAIRPISAADIEAGKAEFKKCALCHTTEAGKNKVGPSLFGIVGRKSASLDGYSYSEAMKKFDHIWDPRTLDTYLSDPRAVVPGTKMIFPGIKDDKERQDVIAYLETLK